MTINTRRHFLKMSLNSAAVLSSYSFLPKELQTAINTEQPKGTRSIEDIQHIVIFMQENRSFDHYFGTLKGVRGFNDPRGILLPNGKSVWHQPKSDGTYVLPFHFNTKDTNSQWLNTLDHSWKKSQKLWENHNSWISKKGPMSMGYFNRNDIPFYYALADAFTIGDAYHSSIFASTGPNRLFLFSGTSGLAAGDLNKQVIQNHYDWNSTANIKYDDPKYEGFLWKTYPERLQSAGISWKVYQEYENFCNNSLAYFKNFRNLDKSSPLYERGRSFVNGSNGSNKTTSNGQFLVDAFAKDLRNNTLPQVSWIVAPMKYSEHPCWPPSYGESLTCRLLNELAKNLEVWSKTVFIICYDENDGFFDHIPPPIPAIHSNFGLSTVSTEFESYLNEPVGLGIRVPLIIVSPWTKGGKVCSEVFDHTSIIRFIESRFQVYEPNISPWRRALCGDLISMFDFNNVDRFCSISNTNFEEYIDYANSSKNLPNPSVPLSQILPRQEKGVKVSCPLNYKLIADGRYDYEKNYFWIDFKNIGLNSGNFQVYSKNSNQKPKHYLVEPQKKLSDFWSVLDNQTQLYELFVHGPNGFYRYFKGSSTNPNLEVSLKYTEQGIVFYFYNKTNGTYHFKLEDNSYGINTKYYTVSANSAIKDTIDLTTSLNWYDFTVTVDNENNFIRKFCGRFETRNISYTDPLIGK